MELGKVIGNVWATKKDERLSGQKLLIVEPWSMNGAGHGGKSLTIAADIVGAGTGDTVLVVRGGSARYALSLKETPIDAAVVGIVDSVVVDANE